MKLDLPQVTLVMIETREHALAELAIAECVKRAKFAEVLVFTDKPELFNTGHVERVPDWPEKIGWSRFLWNEVAQHLRTSHMLSIQWDSWIWDTEKWRPDYLDYDYIGAPWWYKDGLNVGNGGFSLRSTVLMRYLARHRDKFPCTNHLDDDLLCRKYRPTLQGKGFTWAPQAVAEDFAFECVRPRPDSRHFGFHGAFNFGEVLTPAELKARMLVMKRSKYITGNDRMWKSLCDKNPELAAEVSGATHEHRIS